MPLTIRRVPGGPLETNAYLIMDTTSGDAIVIDAPGDTTETILQEVNDLGATVHQIVVTHGHWDHIQDLRAMSTALDAPVFGHPQVRSRIEQPGASPTPVPVEAARMSGELDEGDDVAVGGHRFDVMHMPGHDIAHIILYSKNDHLVFGGDVLFPGGHGRTDIPGSDQQVMNRTLRRFLDLPADVRVFPGHGDETTLQAEQAWIRQIPAG